MARGPYADGLRPVYTLTFSPSSAPTAPPEYDNYGDEIPTTGGDPFSIGAHLKMMSAQEKNRLGYDPIEIVLEVLCADPKEGDSRIAHGMIATIEPSFQGLSGTLEIKGRPESRLQPVVEAIGVKYAAVFQG